MNHVIFIYFVVLVEGVVCSECDTYVECVGSYFESFFTKPDSFVVDDTFKVKVPGFDNKNGESVNLFNILNRVSEFLKEEITNGFQFGPPTNIIYNTNNNTKIYVKTVLVSDGFDYIPDDGYFQDFYQDTNSSVKNINLEPQDKIERVQFDKNDTLKNVEKIEYNIELEKNKKKINENVIQNTDIESYYDVDDNSTDYPIIDYIELYKDTTNEYIETKVEATTDKEGNKLEESNDNVISKDIHIEEIHKNVSDIIFPWVAAIFIKNDTSDQFDYYCDGALLSNNVIVTAARCLQYYGVWVKPENVLVLLGKTSLRLTNENEMIVQVQKVILHENFTKEAENDVAILIIATTATSSVPTFSTGEYEEAFTTGWAVSGELTLIPFNQQKDDMCRDVPNNNTFCATYSNDVTVCPSHGGIFVVRQTDTWSLRGIRYGDPSDRGICYLHNIYYTNVSFYVDWIKLYA